MTHDEMRAHIARVNGKMRVTKVVATRAVKTPKGEFFAGFSAAWDSIQESGPGADLNLTMEDQEASSQGGMTIKEATTAHSLLAMQADLAAYRTAYANGALTKEQFDSVAEDLKKSYSRIIRSSLLS